VDRSGYAGIVTRLAALAIDVALLTVLVPVVATGAPAAWAAVTGGAPGWLSAGAEVVAALVPAAYFAGCWWGTGQTAGGLLVGAVLRRPDQSRVGAVRAVLRAVIGLLLPPLWLAGLLTIVWDPHRRALHDRLFGTVVRRKSASAATSHDED
jgi:uncharacterized RDD family membrane protein YckC